MPNAQNLIPKDLSKRPDHKELARKGGKAKSKAKTLANQLKGMKTATDPKKLKFYQELCADPELSQLELLRIAKELYPKLKKEHNQVNMIGQFIALHKAIHGEKIKTENVHHVVDWSKLIGDIVGAARTRRNKESD